RGLHWSVRSGGPGGPCRLGPARSRRRRGRTRRPGCATGDRASRRRARQQRPWRLGAGAGRGRGPRPGRRASLRDPRRGRRRFRAASSWLCCRDRGPLPQAALRGARRRALVQPRQRRPATVHPARRDRSPGNRLRSREGRDRRADRPPRAGHAPEHREARAVVDLVAPSRTAWLGRDARLLMLTWVAGHMDAISYLCLGHVFTAMMTGNTVLLGLALAQGAVSAAMRSVLALGGFLVGAGMGALIVERERRHVLWPSVVTGALALEGVILALFTITWQLTGPGRSVGTIGRLILLAGGAMGIQSAAVRRLGVPGIATTYITGTLTSLMVDLVGWFPVSGEPPPSTPDPDASRPPSPS